MIIAFIEGLPNIQITWLLPNKLLPYNMLLFAGEGPDSDISCDGDFPAAPAMGVYKGRFAYEYDVRITHEKRGNPL